MLLLRSLLYFLLLTVSIPVFTLPMIVPGLLLPFHWRAQISNAWGRSNLLLLKWICRLDYTISGTENIPSGPVIYMSKHQSAWETIALRGLLTPLQTWVLKRELMWLPVFGWALATVEPIAIDRKSGRRAVREVVEQGQRRLAEGRSVIIFPEGTRVAPGQKKRYGIGGALLAERSGYPILPIAHNAGVYWRRRGIIKYPGRIQLVIGPVIETKGLNAKDILEKVEDWIESTVESLPSSPTFGQSSALKRPR